mmetsp:Transcript_21719/g.53068  ORF Transcript_21719/g.53068 Transcript_21719/m.53068 type:complete len:202 (+) Transcript_21719:185-790(+)
MPGAIPYEPSDATPIDTCTPSGVPSAQSRTWSTMALAALMAELSLRAAMIAAPRFCTVLRKSPSSHASSFTAARTVCLAPSAPTTSAWFTSGYCVDEWLPHTMTLRTVATGTLSRSATCAHARLWSRRVRHEKAVAGSSGAAFIATAQLVLAGLPTTSTLTLFLACACSAAPCSLKIEQFFLSRSARSMPSRRGNAPTMMQ